jgi:ubiquitin C-terminal hydrolase
MNIAICGLVNLGNTCYFNSVVQLLLHCPSFLIYLKKYENTDYDIEGTFTHEFIKIFKSYSGLNKIITPQSLINLFYEKFDYFNNGQQQDAHECLNLLLDSIHEESTKKAVVNIKNKNDYNNENDEVFNDLLKGYEYIQKLYNKKYNPFINDINIFEINCIECNVCGHKTKKYEHTTILQLKVENDLINSLNNYSSSSKALNYVCDVCKSNNNNIITKIYKTPKTLFVQLKRFEINLSRNKYEKNNDIVSFPLNINIKSFCHESLKNKDNNIFEYYFVGCINHYGSMNGGHYNCEAYNIFDSTIYKFDDSNVYINKNNIINNESIYIAMYSNESLVV